jgi:short-subunit dehydrogenase
MVTALITGASSGIGKAFAQALAARGYDLILVARSEGTLTALAGEIGDRHGIQAWAIAQDLTEANGPAIVAEKARHLSDRVDLLINNAGYGIYGAFAQGDADPAAARAAQLGMVQLNVAALVDLTYQFLPAMVQRRSGTILNVGSTASYQPIPYFAVYAATKAFVLSFSEALWAECKPVGVKVMAVCPGPTETQFFKTAQFPSSMANQVGQNYSSPEAVVATALESLDQDRSNVVAGGFTNQLMVNVARFLPREPLVEAVGKMFQSPSGQS